jgi:predicted phosphohydrolase
MKIFGTSDLHLAIANPEKSMAKFGGPWINHLENIREGWSCVDKNDIVIVAGDVSWCSNIYKGKADFDFIESLPGKKILTIGNHDYYYQTATKTNEFLFDNYKTIVSLTSNDYFNLYDTVAILSVKGYMNETHPEFKEEYRKGYNKECTKLENTLKIIPQIFTTRILVSHYPPIHKSYKGNENTILRIMQTYNVTECIYGHLHGPESEERYEGIISNIKFTFVAGDSFNFKPRLIREI